MNTFNLSNDEDDTARGFCSPFFYVFHVLASHLRYPISYYSPSFLGKLMDERL